MWLALCDPRDVSALWAVEGLRARGLTPFEVLTPKLLLASRWEHRVGGGDGAGGPLAPGRAAADGGPRGALNRISYFDPSLFGHMRAEDRLYAAQEMTALYLSWLTAVPAPVINRPTPQGLCGAWRHPSEWAVLAAKAGLPALPFRQRNGSPADAGAAATVQRRTVFVVERRVVGDPPPKTAPGCLQLSLLAKTDLLAVDFVRTEDERWLMAGANPQPDLRRGGEALLDALADVFTGGNA